MAAQALDIKHDTNAPAYRGGEAPMISMIERVVLDPNASVDKLERVLQLRNEEVENARRRDREDEALAAKKSYFKAMSACQNDIPVVIRSGKNKHTSSTYADLADIEKQAMPVIHKHGFAVSFQPDGYNENGELRILWEISHEDGHSRNGVGEIPVDGAGAKGGVNKTGTQAFGSTATYGRRYLLCMLFNISTGDDKDGNMIPEQSGPISDEQVVLLRELIERSGAQIDIVCERYKIDAIPDLPSNVFNECFRDIENWWKRQQSTNGGAK
ncbi:ERF family protein [Ochrobactrum sp. EDr1-4]|uniref:ERF family protein n=1 Tax=Ochrobactrum sp. EDr1-4 TaxID=3368622 RepID=UPI003BA35B32